MNYLNFEVRRGVRVKLSKDMYADVDLDTDLLVAKEIQYPLERPACIPMMLSSAASAGN